MPTTDLMYLLNVLPTMLGVVASVVAVVCERMQQFLTIRTRDNIQQGVCKRTQHVKVMLYETVRNDDCLRNTALQHCCGIVSNGYNIVPTLQRCVVLKIVVANGLASVCTGLYMYPNTSFIHITRYRRSFFMFVALRARKIRYYLVVLA